MKKLLVALLSLILVFGLTACGGEEKAGTKEGDTNELVGTWLGVDDQKLKMVFTKDKVTVNGDSGSYEIEGGSNIIMTKGDESLTISFEVNGNELILTEDGDEEILYKKGSKEYENAVTAKEKEIEKLLEGKVKIPESYFKTQEQVESEFEAAGLKVEFFPYNFDSSATTNKRYLKKGECNQVEEQSARQYFDRDKVGDKFGFYADKGATINIGYSDHDFDGTKGEK